MTTDSIHAAAEYLIEHARVYWAYTPGASEEGWEESARRQFDGDSARFVEFHGRSRRRLLRSFDDAEIAEAFALARAADHA
jgi:hypothetical protein